MLPLLAEFRLRDMKCRGSVLLAHREHTRHVDRGCRGLGIARLARAAVSALTTLAAVGERELADARVDQGR